jgi:hypothetical protein
MDDLAGIANLTSLEQPTHEKMIAMAYVCSRRILENST